MEVVPAVRAGREVGRVRERELAFGVAQHRLGPEDHRRRHCLHVTRRRKRACDVVGGNPVGRDLYFAGRLSEERRGGKRRGYEGIGLHV